MSGFIPAFLLFENNTQNQFCCYDSVPLVDLHIHLFTK